ncbi:MAG: lipid A export permease/ATP-binding protein MsbA [Pseudomonadales bacterium]|nr:lipid A export permease/ATP-binding protein MsbA [Pseudomonadales bacterium]
MWFSFLLSIVGFLLGAGAETYFAKLLKDIINAFSSMESQTGYFFAGMMLLAVFARGLGELSGEFFLSRISFQVIHKLRIELFDRLLVLPSGFFDLSTSGKLISRITFNVAQLKDTATEALKIVIQDGAKVIAFMSALLYINWKLTLIFLVIAPVVGLIVAAASKRFRRISERVQSSMSDITHVTAEAVNSHRVIRTFGGAEYERRRFFSTSNTNRAQSLKMVITKVVSTQIIQLLVALSLAFLVVLLFREDVRSGMNAGEIVEYLTLAGFLARPLKKLSAVNARLQKGLAAATDVFSQLDEKAELDLGKKSIERAAGHIEFRAVNFSYSAERERVLQNVNLSIKPGQTVAVVGQSGSGKSTLAGLISRFYDPDGGEILLDGEPLKDYTLQSLRKQIAIVSQQVTLFNDTLNRNIAYGDLEGVDPEAISAAIEGAHATEFIEQMPDGLDTLVGDNGVLLSGGQRQRVAIARALLKDAPILILDEATSALDTESERHIQAALELLMRGRTTLVIAHRLSTIEKADLIVVLQEGLIVESGSHDDLLKAGGAYAGLHKAQFSGDEQSSKFDAQIVKQAPVASISNTELTRNAVSNAINPLVAAWYHGSHWPKFMLPIAGMYRFLVQRKRHRYVTGKKKAWRAAAPVIIVGNLTVGGTGKTPFIIWLAKQLVLQGYKPGIVSRGYGGKSKHYPVHVGLDSLPQEVGDEPIFLASRTNCPVYVDPNRVQAVQALLEHTDCDIVLSDDGLQHYALSRDIEIVVFDASRGVGNGYCLPAGPLREPLERIKSVDLLISNGEGLRMNADMTLMKMQPSYFINLANGEKLTKEEFNHDWVHAVAAVGNPERFLETIESCGLQQASRLFADHHLYSVEDVTFSDNLPVVMTEKDAVKVRLLTALDLSKYWYLEVEAEVSERGLSSFLACLKSKGISPREQ